jgi:hypothetical protein
MVYTHDELPFLALLATDGSKAAYRIISVCSNAVR